MNPLIFLAGTHWNRMDDAFASLTTVLTDHGMSWESTPTARYPARAARYHGEWSAHRFAVVLTISLILGKGDFEEFKSAQGLVDEWLKERLSNKAVTDRLHQLLPTAADETRQTVT